MEGCVEAAALRGKGKDAMLWDSCWSRWRLRSSRPRRRGTNGVSLKRAADVAADLWKQPIELLEDRKLPAVITVTSLADTVINDGQVTLREAIQAANTDILVDGVTGRGADTIKFDHALTANGPATILLTQGQLEISSDIDVIGTTPYGITISGSHHSRILSVSNCTTSLRYLTFQDGANVEDGGAIATQGTLTLVACALLGNSSQRFGGAIMNSGGHVALVECTLSGNRSAVGAAYADSANGASLTVDQSTIVGNISQFGGALHNGYYLVWYDDDQYYPHSNMKVTNSIVAGNTATSFNSREFPSSSPDISGYPISSQSSHNLVGISSEELATVLDLNIGDHGGPTKTFALLKDGPAIDAGSNALLPHDGLDLDGDGRRREAVPFDQRGLGYRRVVGGVVDIGAAEYEAPRFSISAVETAKPEGQGDFTQFAFKVVRFGDSVGSASVSFAVSGRGNNPADAADFGGSLRSGTVDFAPAERVKMITIDVSGDTAVERSEGFFVTLSNPSEGTTLAKATALGRILNDDASISIKATAASKSEGNDGTTSFVFTIVRTGDTSNIASTTYIVTGRGAHPSDAADFGGTLPSGQVDFAAGESEKNISILVRGDAAFEKNEGFLVTLSSPSVGSTLALATAMGTILNDD